MIVAAAEAICLRNRTRLIDDEDRNLAPQKARFCFCLFQQRLAQTCAPGTHASGPFEHLIDGWRQWVDAFATGETELRDFYYARFRPEFKPAVR